ncbi:MAG: DEAD/DEAH box helicase [Polyangiaceae bacterium]
MQRAPWRFETGLDPLLERWERERAMQDCIVEHRVLPAREARHATLPEALHPRLTAALGSRGITSLYSHQARAFAIASARRHMVVATPTASGKSLCFHLPVLDRMARDPEATAIYLYPTKALSRDQEAGLHSLVRDADIGVPAIVFDGDTPGDARKAARERCRALMTNPDMLHAGILPHHANWARLFSKLAYVVIDELHTYRGVFGSHVSHVLARLRRVARFHGSDPTFLCATATIGNPVAHASALVGVEEQDMSLVDDSGAPTGARHVILYNPPVVNAELGIRASYLKSAVRVTADLARARVPTIVFGHSRNSVEIMLKYLREELADEVSADALMAYRGGYLPDARRKIERGLRAGEILVVVATNALELGIDVGDLDAVVCAGYPGSVAGTWQRFGRAGRRGKASAAVLITSSTAIDQFLAAHPSHLVDGSIEEARIDPKNTEVLIQHLKCAAFELPFNQGERFGPIDTSETADALGFLESHAVVHESGGRFHWSTDAYPANHVSLRSIGWDNTVIIDVVTGRALGELDWRATPTMLHEQAIYQHDAEQYQVERLDHENHKAFVRKVEPDHFTTALTHRKISIIEVDRARRMFGLEGSFGEISVVEKVTGFKKVKFFTHENAGYGDVRLPDIQMHTASFWLPIGASICRAAGLDGARALDALRGVLRAVETVATIMLMCDPRDIGQTIEDGDLGDGGAANARESGGFDPTLFLFDNVPGGIGLAARIYDEAEVIFRRAEELIRGCACAHGCPLCVGAVADPAPTLETARGQSRKRSALSMLSALLRDLD